MRKVLILTVVSLSALYGTGVMPHRERLTHKPVDPLTDSLLTAYARVQIAAATGDAAMVARQLDADELKRLERSVRRDGYGSLRGYIEMSAATWPHPDTLSLCDTQRSGRYARLAFAGAPRLGSHDNTVHYTFVLFHNDGAQWRLAGITGFDKERTGLYGTPVNYNETELPDRFRFPRLF